MDGVRENPSGEDVSIFYKQNQTFIFPNFFIIGKRL